MPSDVAISVRNVAKHYRLFGHPGDRIKQFMSFGLRRYHREFVALHNVSFEVGRGESVGIVGRNGSGKSTLLQLVAGIIKPTIGDISVNGRISALLELGAGFNPEFTGRENVHFQGVLMGLSRLEIANRFEQIVDFADIGEYIDQPVRTYSSGMFVRLAFAVAVHVDPEVLLVDEALSVGDDGFQRKCFSRISAMRAKGATIVFVSHSAAMIIDLCDRAIFLDSGEIVIDGNPKAVLDQYNKVMNAAPAAARTIAAQIRTQISSLGASADGGIAEAGPALEGRQTPASRLSYESRGARIHDAVIVDLDGRTVSALVCGGQYVYRYFVYFDTDATNARCAMMIKTKTGYELGGLSTHAPGSGITHISGGKRMQATFPFTCQLLPGRYFMNAGVLGNVGDSEVFLHRVIDIIDFEVRGNGAPFAGGVVDFGAPGHMPELEDVGGLVMHD